MDAPGELTELGQMVRPQVAIINNCQRAHIGNFSSLDDIAAAKGELITTLPVDGVAVLNAADPYLNMWQQLAGTRQVLTFGFPGEGADFCGDWDGKHLQLPNGTQVMLRVPGMHNARNALAAAAAAQVLKLPETAVCTGLESFTGVAGRLRFIHRRQLLIIDDSYNANPDSALAAMAVLSDCDGEKIAVLGDMLALGKAADAAHRQIIDAAQQANATVFAVGEHMQAATGSGFSSKAALLKALNARLDAAEGQIVVLVKGSRGMKMEDIVSTLEQRS
jgi:UDP-N-acetylmuramoyl-tripeptide--D-alanyl-D-alanine ligase